MSEFLSTPSARRATDSLSIKVNASNISIHALREEGDTASFTVDFFHRYFYPRPPRGGRLSTDPPKPVDAVISIHALREEGDDAPGDMIRMQNPFLSTPSVRRATHVRRCHGGHDWYFYPRPPRGGRPGWLYCILPGLEFLSTPSVRRAT